MTRDRVIGVDGAMPWHYSEDLKRFKRRTMGCAILMGRVTWDSIGREELPGRRTLVISRSVVPGSSITAALRRRWGHARNRIYGSSAGRRFIAGR